MISSLIDPTIFGELVANSHLSNRIVSNGKSGWLNRRNLNLRKKIHFFLPVYKIFIQMHHIII